MASKKIVPAEIQINPRQTKLLFAIIKEFCDSGAYLGSIELKEKFNFDFSPATIRNELVKLRDMGYLYQPFVNSPSIPTEKAFKLFINQLILGLSNAAQQQSEMREQIMELYHKHENLNKEISRLVSEQTDMPSFSVSKNSEAVTGMKHLMETGATISASNIIEFLENMDTNKKYLLSNQVMQTQGELTTVFGGDSKILPLSEGYAMIATQIKIGDEETVIGIISPINKLADPKAIEVMNSLTKRLGGR